MRVCRANPVGYECLYGAESGMAKAQMALFRDMMQKHMDEMKETERELAKAQLFRWGKLIYIIL